MKTLMLLAFLALFQLTSTFITNPLSRISRRNGLCMTESSKKWPGTRPPINNLDRLDQSMDATWGRGKFRTEVWEDNSNPVNDWWIPYLASEEEVEASEAGYDFKNPQAWFEERGIDYEKALLEQIAVTEERYAEFVKQKEQKLANFNFDEFKRIQEEFFELQRRAFEVSFRLEDDVKQVRKGQPSLSVEDTGKQWKDNPI